MIIDVKKYLVIGVKEEIDAFFKKAQDVGIAEFISPHLKKTEYSLEIQHLLLAMKILRKLPVKNPYLGGGELPFADEVAVRIIELKAEVERLSEEKRLVEAEIFRVAPFGDFSLDDIDFIEKEGKYAIQFFCNKSTKSHDADSSDRGMFFIGSHYDLDYFMGIHKEPIQCQGKIEMRIDRPWGELQTHLGFVKESLHQIEAELKGYAGHLEFLHEALLERLNEYHLAAVKRDLAFPLDNSLFVIEAWVPQNKTAVFYSIIDGMAIHCEPVLVEETDQIPTYMENKGIPKLGEELVKIYDVPAYNDRDPSAWVFWFFVLFFSMIVNDGGYGLLYLGLCVFAKWKFPHLKAGAKRMLRMATILSTGCVIWGVLTASFFGLEIDHKGWLGKLSVVQEIVVQKADYHLARKDGVYKEIVSQFPEAATVHSGEELLEKLPKVKVDFSRNFFLEFSLFIGIIHISLSLLRYLRRHFAAIGWVAFIWGAYLYFPSILKATSMVNYLGIMGKMEATEVGLQIIYTGIISAVVLALVQKRLKGIGEISTLISVFADVLSYLRLYALGLSTAIMAETFNDLGQKVGLFLGVLVIVAGHGITILMGLMTGVIHGLRLNFIEWYHYSFIGGGRLFRPLMCFKNKERS